MGYAAAEVLGQTNNTVNYILYYKGKRVYDGICYEDRLDDRIADHERSGKRFDDVVYDYAKPRSEALVLERKRIKRFKCKSNIHHNY